MKLAWIQCTKEYIRIIFLQMKFSNNVLLFFEKQRLVGNLGNSMFFNEAVMES